jgi:hypothetical protein
MELPITIAITGAASLVFVFCFWKKPNLLSTTLIIPVILGIIGTVIDPPNPCSFSYRTSITRTVTGALLLATFVASVIFVFVGIYQRIIYSKDVSRKHKATQRILAGGITIILTIAVFIIVNIIIQALGVGSLACLNIPTLQQFKTQ